MTRIRIQLVLIGIMVVLSGSEKASAEPHRRPVARALFGAGRVVGFGAGLGVRAVGRTAVAGARIVAGTAVVGAAVVAGTAIVGARIVGRTAVAVAAPFAGAAVGFAHGVRGFHGGRRFACGPVGCFAAPIEEEFVTVTVPVSQPERSYTDSSFPAGANFRVDVGGGSCLATLISANEQDGPSCSALISTACLPADATTAQFRPGSSLGNSSLVGQPILLMPAPDQTAKIQFACPAKELVQPVGEKLALEYQVKAAIN